MNISIGGKLVSGACLRFGLYLCMPECRYVLFVNVSIKKVTQSSYLSHYNVNIIKTLQINNFQLQAELKLGLSLVA